MSKHSIWILIFIVILFFFIYGFSNSYLSRNLSNLAYVLSLGVDKGENAKLKITAQFSKPSAISGNNSSSGESSSIVLASSEADSIFSGLTLLNSYIGKEINLAHCSVVVISKELAESGISQEIHSLINNEEIRPGANLVISNCSAYDYISNATPNLESLTSHYYETFSITSKFTGYISDITIGNFFNDLSGKSGDSTAVLGGLNLTAKSDEESSSQNSQESSSQNIETSPDKLIAGTSTISGERGIENLGLAVFKNDKYCGNLTATETISHLLINNKINSCIISIDSPLKENSKIEIQVSPEKKTKISTIIENGGLKIGIKLKLAADVITLENDTDYENNEVLELISKSAESYLTNEFNKYFNKVSREYSVDIDKFCFSSLKFFPTEKDFKDFNWKEKYKNAEFTTDIDVNVVSSLLVTET